MSDPGAFWLAIQAGDLAAVKRLIYEDGSLLDDRADSGHTPLRMACDYGQRQLATALLELGAIMDVFDACALGDSVKALSILDGEPELLCAYSHDGWTPLHLACFCGSQELVAGLLERGAPMTAISRNPTRRQRLSPAIGVFPNWPIVWIPTKRDVPGFSAAKCWLQAK
jgi:ankyrin repeat protein